MTGAEWGPKDLPLENRQLREVTRFLGPQLVDIGTRARQYFKDNPRTTREHAVTDLTQTGVEAKRFRAGLDTLVQLAIIGRDGNDIHSVIVREDLGSVTARNPRQHHYYYEINWVEDREPAPKPQPTQEPPVVQKVNPPTKTVEQNRAKIPTPAGERQRSYREQRTLYEQALKERRERAGIHEEIEAVIIDTGRELAETVLKADLQRIELDAQGQAIILRREFLGGPLNPVARQTGEIKDETAIFSHSLKPQILRYFNFIANVLEGKQVPDYAPDPLASEVCQTTYDLAIKSDKIRVRIDKQTGVVFSFLSSELNGLFRTYEVIDLKNNTIASTGIYSTERPLHPDFADFLRKKKAELDSLPVQTHQLNNLTSPK